MHGIYFGLFLEWLTGPTIQTVFDGGPNSMKVVITEENMLTPVMASPWSPAQQTG